MMDKKAKKSVSFQEIEVREYDMVISTNPGGTGRGPGIELGWEYQLAESIHPLDKDKETKPSLATNQGRTSVDDYENCRPSEKRPKFGDFFLFFMQRVRLLKEELGYTDEEINAVIRERTTLSQERQRSKQCNVTAWQQAKPRRIKKVRRAVQILSKKQQQPPHDHNTLYSGWWMPLALRSL